MEVLERAEADLGAYVAVVVAVLVVFALGVVSAAAVTVEAA